MSRPKIYIHNLVLFLILFNILFSSEYPYFDEPAKQLEFERNKITYSEENYDYNKMFMIDNNYIDLELFFYTIRLKSEYDNVKMINDRAKNNHNIRMNKYYEDYELWSNKLELAKQKVDNQNDLMMLKYNQELDLYNDESAEFNKLVSNYYDDSLELYYKDNDVYMLLLDSLYLIYKSDSVNYLDQLERYHKNKLLLDSIINDEVIIKYNKELSKVKQKKVSLEKFDSTLSYYIGKSKKFKEKDYLLKYNIMFDYCDIQKIDTISYVQKRYDDDYRNSYKRKKGKYKDKRNSYKEKIGFTREPEWWLRNLRYTNIKQHLLGSNCNFEYRVHFEEWNDSIEVFIPPLFYSTLQRDSIIYQSQVSLIKPIEPVYQKYIDDIEYLKPEKIEYEDAYDFIARQGIPQLPQKPKNNKYKNDSNYRSIKYKEPGQPVFKLPDYDYSIETLYQLCDAYNRKLYKEIKNSRWK